jgi:hypothetical protein
MRFGVGILRAGSAMAVVFAISAGLSAPAQATVTFFNDRTSFDAAAGTLSLENFANLATSVGLTPNHFVDLASPINSSTQNVLPGFSLVAAPFKPSSLTGTSIQQDFMGVSGIAVSSAQFGENFSLQFSPKVTAVGFDLQFFNPAGGITPTTIGVDDASGQTGSKTFSANGFFGVVVSGDTVADIEVPQPGNGSDIENLAFGGSQPTVASVPEPPALAILAPLLLGFLVLRRRQTGQLS